MPGEDDEIRIRGSFDGELAEALERIESRLERLERSLDSAGDTAQSAGRKISDGADEGAKGLERAEKAAGKAQTALEGVETAADGAGDELRDTGAGGRAAAGGLDDTADSGRGAAKALGDVGDKGRSATAGLEATEGGAGKAAGALGHTAREARSAARGLDDAGDEAATAGAKAATSALLWERLAARIDRNERVSARWARLQSGMRWSSWSSGVGKFGSMMRGVVNIDYDKAGKGLSRLGKQFGGFTKVFSVGKLVAIGGAIYALLGAISALGAGAVGGLGGILSMVPALGAVAGVAVIAKLAMAGLKAGLKESQPEVDALKAKFQGFGASVAAGGLRKGITGLTADLGPVVKMLNGVGFSIGGVTAELLGGVGDWVKGARALNLFGVIADHVEDIYADLGWTAFNVGKMMLHGLAASMPAAMRLSGDVGTLTTKWSDQAAALYDSGRMTQVVSQAYENLRRALGVVADWTVGLFRIFRIGAQESAWMGDSIERSAQKFRDWTGTIEGQNAIRKYFADAMPAVREAGLLVRDIFFGLGKMAADQNLAPLLAQIRTELVPALLNLFSQFNTNLLPGLVTMATLAANIFAGLDFSGLTVLVDMINGFLQAILWAQQNVPGFNFILSTLLTTMFLLGPVATVAGKAFGVFGKIGDAFSWISKAKAGTGELTRMQKILGPAFQFVGRVAGWFGSIVGRAILWVVTTFGRLGGVIGILRWIGSAFMLLVGIIGWPVTLIIAAVVAIVAIFIYLWNNCTWFREGVINILTGIGNFFVTLWRDYVWPALSAIGEFFVWLWQSVLVPVGQGIWTVLKVIGAILFVIFVGPFILAFNTIAALASWFYNAVIVPVFTALGEFFGWVFNSVIMPVVNFFVWLWNMACAMVLFAYYMYVVPALTAIGAFFGWVFNSVIMPIVNFFVWLWNMAMAGVALVYYTILQPALQAIGDFFSWVFNSVIMPIVNFFVWLWNMAMLSLQLAYYMYVVPMFNAFMAILNWLWLNVATPVINGILFLWNGLQSGISWVYYNLIKPVFDAIGAALNVLQGWFQWAVDGIGRIWNNLRGALAAPVNFLIGWVWNKGILPAWNWVAEKLGLPLGQPIAEIPLFAAGGRVAGKGTGTSDDIPAMLSNGEHVWTDSEVRGAGGHKNVMRLRKMAEYGALPQSLQYYASGGPVTPEQMMADVKGPFPSAVMSDGYSPRPGWHGKNRAVDIVGPMQAIDRYIGEKYPGSEELIHTPGPYNIKSGRPHTYNAATRADHYDHVHWANNGSAGGEGGFLGGIMQTLWEIGKPILDGILNPIIDGIPWHGPPQFLDIPKKGATTARDAFYKWAEEKLSAISVGGGGDAIPGSGPVFDQVSQVAERWGWGPKSNPGQWGALARLIQKESSWIPTNKNPGSTAYGLFQFLDGTWGTVGGSKTDNPGQQTEYGLRYIKNKYRDPAGALAFHNAHNWYDDGGYLPPGVSTVMNGTGRPEPVFTSSQWDLLAGALPMVGDPFAYLSDGSDYIAAMMNTPQTYEAVEASGRDRDLARLEHAVEDLTDAIRHQKPPLSVSGGVDVRGEVEAALAAHDRRRALRERYRIGK